MSLSPLPTVEEYLRGLPHGLDSYPHAQVKGAIVRAALQKLELEQSPEIRRAPPCVADLARAPPTVGDWVPEAHYGALWAAIYDIRFRSAGGMAAFDRWALDGKRKVVHSPLYKVLFLVIKPERVFIGLGQRWQAFHRGSTLSVVELRAGAAQVRLAYPPRLFTDYSARAVGLAFQAAGEATGAKNIRVTCRSESDASSMFAVEWG